MGTVGWSVSVSSITTISLSSSIPKFLKERTLRFSHLPFYIGWPGIAVPFFNITIDFQHHVESLN